ncbi:FkbM family methyltransferase [Methanoregula sp.]|jgi:FkbM family methyltransferase|uniref:FkbM family methyltransferase n=1 Tax=Methanoregula sp. TaxID=2052170 RepID=UPI003C1B8CFD
MVLWNNFIRISVSKIEVIPGISTIGIKLLYPCTEYHQALFGCYRFKMNLSLGYLQKILFINSSNYEKSTQNLMKHLIKPGMTILDIGANIGFFTLFMAKLIHKEGKIYCFEPHPTNFQLLLDNIKSNDLKNVYPVNLALSNVTGKQQLSLNFFNDGGHSLGNLSNNLEVSKINPSVDKILVNTCTIDEFIAKNHIEKVDFIKIDVEGAEYWVFEGAKKLLSQSNAPDIICEIGNTAAIQIGKKESDIRELLYSFGYRSFFIEDGIREFGDEIPVTRLQNILFTKSEIK